ncbi:hypothetical protein HZH66_004298 [Vespula vulgaris]|uniref:Uncharacterized protein n=1 Tax=Vespula vulgaris TaxID=7454 RepID=A0A834NDM3_VESVU|nr:hypothetical protein HZH66_004298 [Vespula vulgaris]
MRPFSPAGKGHRPEYWDPSGGGKSGKGRALGPREAGGYDGAGGEEAPRPPNTTSLLKERERSSAFKWLVYDLPTYHSMLNFDESLWKFVKEKMRKQRTWLET